MEIDSVERAGVEIERAGIEHVGMESKMQMFRESNNGAMRLCVKTPSTLIDFINLEAWPRGHRKAAGL